MEKIPCINCLVFPICKSKVVTWTPYIGIIGSEILNISIQNMLESCNILQTCVGKTNLFEKNRAKRVQLIKHILGVKKLNTKVIYRLYIDNIITKWLDQFKGESLEYNNEEISWRLPRRKKN